MNTMFLVHGGSTWAEGESDAIATPYNASLALPVSTDFLIDREYQLT
jgi:hypothetical protein